MTIASTRIQGSIWRRTPHVATILLVLVLSACAAGVQRAPEIALQSPQFDNPGEKAGGLTIELTEEGAKAAGENSNFHMDNLRQAIHRSLEDKNLIAQDSDSTLPTINVDVTSVRTRSTFSAIMFGFMAGEDHIKGDVEVRAPSGAVLQKFGVSVSYALGGFAGGPARMDWLYKTFAEHLMKELTGQSGQG